jgi:dTDP-4-amino-4,6-dideoxygalactose transaminase
VAVSSATAGLHLALLAAGIGAGDDVITTPMTWAATGNMILAVGARPVFVDIEPATLHLDADLVERAVTPRTRALLPVHMRGAPADMDALCSIAAEHHLAIVEDVCQAAGASFKGRRLGTFGDAGAFSLQFNKIITTGEGGVMVTDRDDLYDLAVDVHDCAGSVRRGTGLPRFAGWNFRASELQGAIARVQLARLDGLLARMRENHAELSERIGALPGLTLRRPNDDGGDAGICLVAFASTAEQATDAVDALRAEGVTAMRIYDPRFVDLHVYPFWRPVLEAIEAAGQPAPDCPRTLDLLSRSIHVDVSPLCDERDVEEISLAFKKVARAVIA